MAPLSRYRPHDPTPRHYWRYPMGLPVLACPDPNPIARLRGNVRPSKGNQDGQPISHHNL